MKHLTTVNDNKVVVDSITISEGFMIEHRSITRLINSHLNGLEKFGKVRFEITPSKSGQKQSVVYLNEQQTMLLLTYTKSNPKTDEFREKLVKDFYRMKTYLQERSSTLKSKSTKTRNMLTDEWQKNGVKKGWEYGKLTLEEYKVLQFEKGKRKKDFDDGELKTLLALEAMEMLSLHYNSVKGFVECKENMNNRSTSKRNR